VTIVNGASKNKIGGSGGVGVGGAGNVISGNGGDGVRIFGPGSNGNLVQGNDVGTDASGKAALGNTGHGVWLAQGAQNNSIGGATASVGNVIAYNHKAGVAVGTSALDASTLGDEVLSNSIFSNLGLGIDLGDDGVTANTPGSPHMGPNALQNTPVIDQVRVAGSSTTLLVRLNSIPNSTFTIQIFANTTPDPTGFGQGKTLVQTVQVTTDGTGNITGGFLAVVIPLNLAGQYLTATATDPTGDTSEFSQDVQVSATAIPRVASGLVAPGNAGHGVRLAPGAQIQSIGGIDPADGNAIAFYGKAGVAAGTSSPDASPRNNAALSDSVFSNLGLVVDLGDDGVTANVPGGVGPASRKKPGWQI
jgi:titin